jgi:hypothetical protein
VPAKPQVQQNSFPAKYAFLQLRHLVKSNLLPEAIEGDHLRKKTRVGNPIPVYYFRTKSLRGKVTKRMTKYAIYNQSIEPTLDL